jgi:hypothetical protein
LKIELTKEVILKLFNLLNYELKLKNIQGELYLVGGAVMCLAFNTRPSTVDVDAYFAPKAIIKQASKKITEEMNIDEDWLNDAVKGFLSSKGDFSPYLDLSNLKIYCASGEYLFAMKCLVMRLGKEFHDESDIRFLLRYLNIKNLNEAIQIIQKYYDKKLIPQNTFYAIEEFLES